MRRFRNALRALTVVAMAAGAAVAAPSPAGAATSNYKGVNWADARTTSSTACCTCRV
ncbi:hypothetical protein [Dactylosporangium darangshiense]|uniref:hypothetical protein n=1 Tax=Dactylosporangium darangshiense TaxID=579108 RepID=UPI00363ACAC3